MDLKQLKELMAAMGRAGMKRVRIKNDQYEVEIEKEENQRIIAVHSTPEWHEKQSSHHTEVIEHRHQQKPTVKHDIPPSLHPPTADSKKEIQEGIYIKSPMVGTFYASPSPDDPTFVKVGDKVEKNTIVCIIEAMKVMNEVKAGMEGTIVEMLVESGHPVEFGTKLFKIS